MVLIVFVVVVFFFGVVVIIVELEVSSVLVMLKFSSVISFQVSYCWVLKLVNVRLRKLKVLSSILLVVILCSLSCDISRLVIGLLKLLVIIIGSINIFVLNGVFWCINCSFWVISSLKLIRVIRVVIVIIILFKIM